MSTYQIDENDKPVTTHVDMGEIMRPKTSFDDKTTNTDTATDTDRQTDGMVVAKQTGGSRPGVATSGNSTPSATQPVSTRLSAAKLTCEGQAIFKEGATTAKL
ncbi:hypothetical protein Purlil1_13161 [Purpureocillium lilacinum]|uniref:Uncharacterized protein n=1 Tax=Purpureocillium lilacinum TaxID=33203 RepID=A0ABR0BEW4_PURLI|nr:hypothetical protein Purlil1_13161 [Purpureocillium lilacinum]